MIGPTRYKLDVTRDGPFDRRFGWQVVRRDDAVAVERSAQTFGSRREAMAQGLPRAIAWESGQGDRLRDAEGAKRFLDNGWPGL
jgi:hypothetical protein